MKGFRKLTAGFLGVVMALGVCSFTALAEDDTTKEIDSMDDLTAAVNAQADGQTWEITDNFNVTAMVDIHESITINGNDYTLTFTENIATEENKGKNSFIQITGDADVKINDLTLDGKENVYHCINVYGNGEDTKVNLDGVTMENGKGYGLVNNSANVTVKDIETSGNGWGGINVDTAGSKKSTLTIESATIKEENSVYIENKNNAEIKAEIKGGTFEGEVHTAEGVDIKKLSITGGTFKEDVSKYMDENSAFVKDEDGNYVVADKEEIKEKGSKFYISDEKALKDAIEAQADGVTWVFEDETYNLESTIKITKDIANEKDARERCGFHIDNGANVEINDLTIEGNGKIRHGVNVYTGAGQDTTTVTLNNVTMNDGTGYGLVNNASDVTVTDIETSGNGWGGINVDNAAGTSESGAKFVMNSGVINESYSVAFENKTGANIDIKIKDGVFKGYVGYGINNDSFGENVDPEKTIDANIISGTFATDVEKFIDEDSHIVKIDGEYVVMDEEEYDEYLDDQRDSGRHSYSLKEGKTERDDEEEEPVVTPEPEEEEGPFSDVGKDNPNYDAIIEVYEKGWMAGIGDGVFAPNGTLTRGMAVTILWNRAGQPEPASVAPFLDVTSDAWYAKAVAWAYENGITSGYGDTYGPDDFLTTEQFTRMNDIANGRTPEVYVGGAPYATRGWVAGMLVME